MTVVDRPLPFTLRQLQYLLAVEATQGFSRAAEHCHVSQPALSAQIAQLEDALGVQLFERSRRGVVVTPAGEALLERARSVLQVSSELERAAQTLKDPWSTTWRFGIIPTIAPYVLPSLSPSLHRTHRDLKILWREAPTPQLVDELASGRLEAAVLALEADLGGLETHPIHRDPFLVAVAHSHRLAAAKAPVSIDDLDDERLLLLAEEHCLRHQALAVCQRSGGGDEGFEATSLATLMEMVAVGSGVTLLPSVAAETVGRDPRVAIRPFREPAPFRTIGLAWRPSSALGEQLPEVAELFAAGLREALGSDPALIEGRSREKSIRRGS